MDKIQRILNKRENEIFEKSPIIKFIGKEIGIVTELNKLIQGSSISEELKNEARKLGVVKLSTMIGVFLRKIFIELVNKHHLDCSKIIKSKNPKFDLKEINIFLTENISVAEILVEYFNFQKIIDIEIIFSDLLHTSFFNEIKKKIGNPKDPSFTKVYPTLEKLFSIRNRIVHEIHYTIETLQNPVMGTS